MATRSSILAWRISCTEEPGRLQSIGPQRDTTKATQHTCTRYHHCPLGPPAALPGLRPPPEVGDSHIPAEGWSTQRMPGSHSLGHQGKGQVLEAWVLLDGCPW